jgi:hypothetical protein
MVMPDPEQIRAAPWFRVAVAGGQLFRALNLGVLRRTVADVHAQYEAPIVLLQESREGWHYRFGLLLQRANKDHGLLMTVVEHHFSPSGVFGRPEWYRLRHHLGGPEDLVTNEPISPEAEYRLHATTAIWLALEVDELVETGVRGLKGKLNGMRISGVYDTLARVIRHVVRRDAYGPWGEGEHRNKSRVTLNQTSDRIVEPNFQALTGKITKEHYPESSPGAEAELVALESESEFPKAIDLVSLSPAERNAIVRVFDGLSSGYKFDGKRGDSMTEFLGNDYGRVTRAFERARKRLLKGEP